MRVFLPMVCVISQNRRRRAARCVAGVVARLALVVCCAMSAAGGAQASDRPDDWAGDWADNWAGVKAALRGWEASAFLGARSLSGTGGLGGAQSDKGAMMLSSDFDMNIVDPPYFGIRLKNWTAGSFGYGISWTRTRLDPLDRTGVRIGPALDEVTLSIGHRFGDRETRLRPYATVEAGIALADVTVDGAGGKAILGPTGAASVGVLYQADRRTSVFAEVRASRAWVGDDAVRARIGAAGLDGLALNIGIGYRF